MRDAKLCQSWRLALPIRKSKIALLPSAPVALRPPQLLPDPQLGQLDDPGAGVVRVRAKVPLPHIFPHRFRAGMDPLDLLDALGLREIADRLIAERREVQMLVAHRCPRFAFVRTCLIR